MPTLRVGGAGGREFLRPVRLRAQQPEQGIPAGLLLDRGPDHRRRSLEQCVGGDWHKYGFLGFPAFWWLLGVFIWVLSFAAVPIVLFTLGGRVAAGVSRA